MLVIVKNDVLFKKVIVIYIIVLIDILFEGIDYFEFIYIKQKNVYNIEIKNVVIVVENYVICFYIISKIVFVQSI